MWVGLSLEHEARFQEAGSKAPVRAHTAILVLGVFAERCLACVCVCNRCFIKISHSGSGYVHKSCSKGLRFFCLDEVEEVKLENRGTKAAGR